MSRLFGWDLPPGVSTRDLPGNSKEDEEAEAFADAMYDQMPEAWREDDAADKLSNWVWRQIGEAYSKGYQQGNADAQLENDLDAGWTNIEDQERKQP